MIMKIAAISAALLLGTMSHENEQLLLFFRILNLPDVTVCNAVKLSGIPFDTARWPNSFDVENSVATAAFVNAGLQSGAKSATLIRTAATL